MKQGKKCNWNMILFEMRNITGNPFVHIFGIAFPILLVIMIGKAIAAEVPAGEMLRMAQTQVILGVATVIPMATIFMGYACQYSQELEKGIPLRMLLFGYREKYTIINRIIAELIFMSFAFVLYFLIIRFVFPIEAPSIGGIFAYFGLIYFISAILFVLSHAIATIIKKFGATYAIVMILYFAMMILSGMMGVSVDMLPKFVQGISKLIPFYYFNQESFLSLWRGESYNFAPMMQSILFFTAVAGIVLFAALKKTNRKLQ